jgi:hypothetical protein
MVAAIFLLNSDAAVLPGAFDRYSANLRPGFSLRLLLCEHFLFSSGPASLKSFYARNTLVVRHITAEARHFSTRITGGIRVVNWVAEEAVLATASDTPTERQTFVECLLD